MARKINPGATDNAAFSLMDKTALFFVQNCGACHPGGAAAEYDRDGNPYVTFDNTLRSWVFSAARGGVASYYTNPGVGLASGVSGDYAFVNPAAPAVAAARWDQTGVAEADCLMCHLSSGYSWTYRTATLGKGAALLGVSGLPAFAAAATAGAGWAVVNYTAQPPGKNVVADNVTIAYPTGLLGTGVLTIPATSIRQEPNDANCRGCHATPDLRKAGRSWETDTDAHKARALSCVYCHPAGSAAKDPRINGLDMHEIAKGNISVGSARDDIDDTMYRCKECHVDRLDGRAPDPAGAHRAFPPVHFAKLSCNVCHTPYLEDSALTTATDVPDLVMDYTVDGNGIIFPSTRFLSNNPADPRSPLPGVPTSRWYPALQPHAGIIKTVKPLVTIWWGLWNGQQDAASIVKPVILRNLRKAIGFASNDTGAAPGGKSLVYTAKNSAGKLYYFYINTSLFSQLSDANGDGVVDVNTPAEIVAYMDAIGAASDHFAQPIVPSGWQLVLVKSGKVYYKSGASAVSFFESAVAESPPFAINHNVRPSYQALGAGGCDDCHAPGSAFFYRKELKDPYDEADTTVYVNAYETMGYTGEQVADLTAGVPAGDSGISAGSSECFIATAAYGSAFEPNVRTLRRFREMYLVGNPLGRLVVRAYYAVSPPIAHAIAGSETLKALVRFALTPVVAFAAVLLDGTTAAKAAALVLLGLIGFTAALASLRRFRKTA